MSVAEVLQCDTSSVGFLQFWGFLGDHVEALEGSEGDTEVLEIC